MMKKIILSIVALMGCVVLASCDTKLCYCYENGIEEEMYVNSDVSCASYSRGNRGCVEQNERMDPRDIARDRKKTIVLE